MECPYKPKRDLEEYQTCPIFLTIKLPEIQKEILDLTYCMGNYKNCPEYKAFYRVAQQRYAFERKRREIEEKR